MANNYSLPEAINYLVNAAHKAPSADNSQPWHFTWERDTLVVKFDKNRANRLFSANSHAIRLSMGAVLENLSLAQHAAGLITHWQSGNNPGEYARINLDGNSQIPENAWHHPLFSRHTNRGPFQKRGLSTSLLEQLTSIREGDIQLQVFCDKLQIRKISSLVKTASEMRFQMQELHEWLAESLRFTPSEVARGDGLDIQTLALPFGGRLLLQLIKEWKRMAILNHLGAYRMLAAIEAANLIKTAAVIAVTGPSGREHELDAGRTMERAWILINASGAAVHPYYVVSDQLIRIRDGKIPQHLHATANNLIKKKNAFFGEPINIHMLLRVGYPKHPYIQSQRIPLESVISKV